MPPSFNVIGELRGSEKPEEVIVVGGHLDSWDTGEGAHDDGAGCMQSIEVLRTFISLKIRPKRTIRAVMFMNEENGLAGGLAYAAAAEKSRGKASCGSRIGQGRIYASGLRDRDGKRSGVLENQGLGTLVQRLGNR